MALLRLLSLLMMFISARFHPDKMVVVMVSCTSLWDSFWGILCLLTLFDLLNGEATHWLPLKNNLISRRVPFME